MVYYNITNREIINSRGTIHSVILLTVVSFYYYSSSSDDEPYPPSAARLDFGAAAAAAAAATGFAAEAAEEDPAFGLTKFVAGAFRTTRLLRLAFSRPTLTLGSAAVLVFFGTSRSAKLAPSPSNPGPDAEGGGTSSIIRLTFRKGHRNTVSRHSSPSTFPYIPPAFQQTHLLAIQCWRKHGGDGGVFLGAQLLLGHRHLFRLFPGFGL